MYNINSEYIKRDVLEELLRNKKSFNDIDFFELRDYLSFYIDNNFELEEKDKQQVEKDILEIISILSK